MSQNSNYEFNELYEGFFTRKKRKRKNQKELMHTIKDCATKMNEHQALAFCYPKYQNYRKREISNNCAKGDLLGVIINNKMEQMRYFNAGVKRPFYDELQFLIHYKKFVKIETDNRYHGSSDAVAMISHTLNHAINLGYNEITIFHDFYIEDVIQKINEVIPKDNVIKFKFVKIAPADLKSYKKVLKCK